MKVLFQKPVVWFAIALLIRLAYLNEQSSTALFAVQLLDEQENAEAARAILAGTFFGSDPFFKAPLYSIITAGVMAISGESWIYLLRLLQHLLGALLVVLAFDSARHLFNDKRRGTLAGAIAALFLTLHAPLVRLEDRLILDFLVLFFQSAMLWALIRHKTTTHRRLAWCLLAGLFAALAWATRPTLTPIIPFIALWIVGSRIRRPTKPAFRRQLACACAYLLFPIIVMLAVYAHNASSGAAMLLPWQGGYSFYHANAHSANGRYFIQSQFVSGAGSNPTKRIILTTYRDAAATRGDSEHSIHSAANEYWFNRAKDEIRADVPRWLGLSARKALYMLSDREIFNFEDYTVQRRESFILRLLPGRFGLVWPFALASLALFTTMPRTRRGLYIALWIYSMLLAACIALYFTSGRMRMPIVFPAALLAASGIVNLITQRLQLRRQKILAYVLLLGIGAIMSWGDWWGVRSENLQHMEYSRMSHAAFVLGRYDDALHFAEETARANPTFTQLPQLKAQALYGLNRKNEALALFVQAMQVQPADPVAAYNAGLLTDELGAGDPLPYYREALKRDPRYTKAAEAIARASKNN